ELGGDLGRRVGQRLEQGQAQRRLDRIGQPLRRGAHVVGCRVTGSGERTAERFYVRREFHDAIMASLWRHVNAIMAPPLTSYCRQMIMFTMYSHATPPMHAW